MFHVIEGHERGMFYISSIKKDPEHNVLVFYLMNGGHLREQYGSQDEMNNTYNEFLSHGMFVEVDDRVFNVFHFSTVDKADVGGEYFVHIVLRTGETLMAQFDNEQDRDDFYNDILSGLGGLVQVDTYADLPNPGSVSNIYITKDTGQTYYWDGETKVYVTTGTNGRTGVYAYDNELPTQIGSIVVLDKTDLETIVPASVEYQDGSEVIGVNAVHGLIISSTSTTVTVRTITDMTIDSFQQVANESDLPDTGMRQNILYYINNDDTDAFRVWSNAAGAYIEPSKHLIPDDDILVNNAIPNRFYLSNGIIKYTVDNIEWKYLVSKVVQYDLTDQIDGETQTFGISREIQLGQPILVFYAGQLLVPGINYTIDFQNHVLVTLFPEPPTDDEDRHLIVIVGDITSQSQGGGEVEIIENPFNFNGSQQTFNFPNNIDLSKPIIIAINGVMLSPGNGNDYTIDMNHRTVTFAITFETGTNSKIIYYR